VNNDFVGFLNITDNNAESFTKLGIDASMIDKGTNTLTFVQTGNPNLT
jgi:hypothetical protein